MKRPESLMGWMMAVCAALLCPSAHATVTVYPQPVEETASPDYTVWVKSAADTSGQAVPVPVYGSYRFDPKSPQKLWGRPVSPLSFCSVDADEEIEFTVRLESALADAGIDTGKVIVRPLALGLAPSVAAGMLRFKINRQPCQLSVEPGGGILRPLHIFVNPIEKASAPDDPNVITFGPGYREIEGLNVQDGQTVYVAGGAVVELKPRPNPKVTGNLYGLPTYEGGTLINAQRKKNVTIRGRGLLSCRKALQAGQRGKFMELGWCQNLTIEGLILRESGGSGPHVVNGKGAHIDNIKVLCPYVNGDGIIIGGTSNALVENCFAHNADDSLEVKIWIEQHDVEFRHCTVWNDLGGSFGLMTEADAPSSHIAFRDCTVIHATDDASASPVVGIKLDGKGPASHYTFENIVIEHVASPRRPALKIFNNWTGWALTKTEPDNPYKIAGSVPKNPAAGAISHVTLKNITVLDAANTDVVVMADGPAAGISDVTFANVVINGVKLKPGDPRLKTNEWVTGIIVE